MKKLTKVLPVLCLLVQMSFAHAITQKTINYNNQREEIFDLENWLKEIQYKTEEVKDTCHKKVPYEEKVCKDVTKYKKECKTIPAHEECKDVNKPICHTETTTRRECHTPTHRECHNETRRVCHNETRYETQCTDTPSEQQCRTVNEPVCHNETRYENSCRTVPGEQQCRIVIRYHEECNNVPGGRQCRQIPPDIQCRIINGENKCEKIPGHEECTDAPDRRECRQAPYEERECSTGPTRQECQQIPRQEQVCENHSRQECTTIPGSQQCRQVPREEQVCENRSEQVCEDVPGDEICRNVPHQEQVCVDHMERVCENIPAREVCKNVPYKEQVCKMETRYKDEPYECTKKVEVPHEVLLKTHKARVQMNFNTKSSDSHALFKVVLSTNGKLALSAQKDAQAPDQLIFAKKDIKAEEQADINSINAIYNIVLIDKAEYFQFMKSGIQNILLESKSLSFSVDGKIELKRASLAIKIEKKSKIKLDVLVTGSQMAAEFDGEKTLITIDLKKINSPKLGGVFNREHNVNMKLKLDYSDLGDSLINEKEFATSVNVNTKVQ
ncbi:MAG: hypothetical protein WC635_11885 [Bacteriovorax sp.]|jgi:hypothetical protein